MITRAIERAGNQSKLAVLLSTKEQNVRRWINNDDEPSPTHNDQMTLADAMYKRDGTQARAFLVDVLHSLAAGRLRVADPEAPTLDELVEQAHRTIDQMKAKAVAEVQ